MAEKFLSLCCIFRKTNGEDSGWNDINPFRTDSEPTALLFGATGQRILHDTVIALAEYNFSAEVTPFYLGACGVDFESVHYLDQDEIGNSIAEDEHADWFASYFLSGYRRRAVERCLLDETCIERYKKRVLEAIGASQFAREQQICDLLF